MKKISLEEATMMALHNQLDDTKEVKDVEGIIDDVLVITDPEISSDDYDEVIERAQEIVEDTPEGEIPLDDEYLGQYLLTCPICGNSFIEDKILEPGATCPICLEVPEAFVVKGRLEEENEVLENEIKPEEEKKEAPIPVDNKETDELSEEEEDSDKEPVEASEEIKTADNKLEESTNKLEDTEIKEEDKSIEDFYTKFNSQAFYDYIKENLADHLILSNILEDNEYELQVQVQDKATTDKEFNSNVATLTYDKQFKEIRVLFFKLENDSLNYGEQVAFKNIDEAIDKINNYKYDYSDFKKESKELKEEFDVSELKKKAQEILPESDIDTHDSDLYIKVSDKSTELLNKMKDKDCGLLKTFKSDIDGEMWYDIPFANMEDDAKEKSIKQETKKAESLEQNEEDGWGEEIEDTLEPCFEQVERMAYEIRNCVRGSYAGFGDTVEELIEAVDEIQRMFEEASTELGNMKEQLQESITIEEVKEIHEQIDMADDMDEIQQIIYTISDGELEHLVQQSFDACLEDEDSLDISKDFILAVLEDNAEYDED